VRFGGIVAMLVTQLLLADIVRRVTHDVRAVILAVLLPEAALYYGLLMAKVSPDTAMIPCAVAMLWSLVRLHESGNRAGGSRGPVRRAGAAVEIHRDHAAAGGDRVRAGAGLGGGAAVQPLAVSGGADAAIVFLPVLIWNTETRLGIVPASSSCARSRPIIVAPHRRRNHRLAIWPRRFRAAAGGAAGVTLTAWRGYRTRARSRSCCRPRCWCLLSISSGSR